MRTLVLLFALTMGLTAQTVINGSRQILGDWDASSATKTKPAKSGTSLPATCATGEVYFKTDATAGQNLYYCTATNTWTQQLNSGGGGGTVYGEAASLGRFFPAVTLTSSGVGVSTDRITRYLQFSLPGPAVFNTIYYTVNAASSNNCGAGTDPCALAFALYAGVGSPQPIIANSTATGAAPTSTGAKSIAMAADVTLAAGTYFLAYATNSNTLSLGGTTAGMFGGTTMNTGLSAANYRVFEDAAGDVVTVSGTTVTMKSSLVTSGRVNWNPTNMLGVALVRN